MAGDSSRHGNSVRNKTTRLTAPCESDESWTGQIHGDPTKVGIEALAQSVS